MRERAAPPHPEGVLVQLLGHPRGLVGAFTHEKGPQHVEPRPHKPPVGEDRPKAGGTVLGFDDDQGMDRVLGPDLVGPATLGGPAPQGQGFDAVDFHAVLASQNVADRPPSTDRTCPVT